MEKGLPGFCYGTDNIGVDAIRDLLNIVHEIQTLDKIHSGIGSLQNRTGTRPTFHQSEWMSEPGRSAIGKVLRRHYASILATVVRVILGNQNDDLMMKSHDIIRDHWPRGIRIGNNFGDLLELGVTTMALNGRPLTTTITTTTS